MHPYKPGYILTLRVTETGKGNRMKAEVVNDEFQKCTVIVHRLPAIDRAVFDRLARHLKTKPRVTRSRLASWMGAS